MPQHVASNDSVCHILYILSVRQFPQYHDADFCCRNRWLLCLPAEKFPWMQGKGTYAKNNIK